MIEYMHVKKVGECLKKKQQTTYYYNHIIMNFEKQSVNPYEGLDTISLETLNEKLDAMNADQKTWLKAKLTSDLEKVSKEMETVGTEGGYEMQGSPEPIKGESGLTLNDLTLKSSELKMKLEKVEASMEKESDDYKGI